jgi:tRNA uridine 5-carbamoylmethylation protein Kti12
MHPRTQQKKQEVQNSPDGSKNDSKNEEFPLFYKKVITIGDSDALKELNLHRNEAFENTHKLEKRLRGNLKAATERALANKDNLVILDHGNYIKGWRYELHCMAKSTRTKSMILYIEDDDEDKFLENNKGREDPEEAYSEEILHALNFRFEAPNSKNRWDNPMETISNLDHSSLNPETLIKNLAKHFTGETGGAKIKPNNSTQQPKKKLSLRHGRRHFGNRQQHFDSTEKRTIENNSTRWANSRVSG